MDKRIIKFLESGVCEGLYTVTVKEYPVYRDELRGTSVMSVGRSRAEELLLGKFGVHCRLMSA